ncbi:MAG: ABC transporter permease [Dehalococcoidia bacterium]
MTQYIVRRLLMAVPSMLLVSLIIFSLVRLVDGDVVMARLAEGGYVTDDQLAAMRAELGIDRPFVTQYLDYMVHLMRGDFGKSLWDSQPVWNQIVDHMEVSLQLAVMSILLAIVIAIPLGIISAIRANTPLDYGARLFAILGLSLPDFWIATMLILGLTLWVGWLPEFGYWPIWEDPAKNLEALIFPALIVGYRFSATTARMTRSSVLEVLHEDYIRTAWSKGMRERAVVLNHALRNALIPVITIMGGQIGFLLGGLVVIETIFSLPGMGRLMFNAINQRDYPVIQGITLVMASIFILVNLLVDLTYAVIDPRIRYS